MRVPFRLRRQPSDRPTEAVLLEPASFADALPVSAAVALALSLTAGSRPLPSVHRVADGLLLVLSAAHDGPLPHWAELAHGADPSLLGGSPVLLTRLRRLGGHLLLPVDAELIPGLLADEAADLTARRGLVLQPGELAIRASAFDPGRPLAWRELLRADRSHGQMWRRLPPRPPQADRLNDIVVERPPPSVKDILEAGLRSAGPTAGSTAGSTDSTSGKPGSPGSDPSQSSDPAAQGFAAGAASPSAPDAATDARGGAATGGVRGWLGRLGSGLSRGLEAIGQMFSPAGASGSAGSGSAGSASADSASAGSTGSSDDKRQLQDRALQELLERFRSGDIEAALRKALPLGPSGGRGNRPAPTAQLPNHDTRWSLTAALTGGSAAGPAAVWITSAELHAALMTEYRKVAEAAAQAGDARRAAFVYGQLLGDYRRAAEVLANGGLFYDAGVIYREKCEEPVSAAQCFEKAGRVDLALQIYRSRNDHLAAAQLLERIGDVEAALTEYRRAADKRAEQGQFLVAATLMAHNARRPDLAMRYYHSGWSARPGTDALACALQLTSLYWASGAGRAKSDADSSADSGSAADGQADSDAFWELLREADEHFSSAGREPAATEFYNHVARLARRIPTAAGSDDLRDRALLGLAGQLRLRAETVGSAGPVLEVLPGSAGWSAAQAADAAQAFRSTIADRSHASRAAGVTVIRLHATSGDLTTAARAADTDELILGFSSGQVICLRPSLEVTRPVGEHRLPVRAVAASPAGETVAVLCDGQPPHQRLLLYKRNASRTAYDNSEGASLLLDSPQPIALSPTVLTGVDNPVCCWDGRQLLFVGRGFLPACERYAPLGLTLPGVASAEPSDILAGPSANSLTGLYDSVGSSPGPGLGGERSHSPDDSDDSIDLNMDSVELPVIRRSSLSEIASPTAPVLAMPLSGPLATGWSALLFHGAQVVLALPPKLPWRMVKLPWTPSPTRTPSWLPVERGVIELASVDTLGRLGWAGLELSSSGLRLSGTAVYRADSPYLAVAVLGPGQVLGVRASGLDWLRVSSRSGEPRFELTGRTPYPVGAGAVVAAFPAHQPGHVVIVRRCATLLRAHWPS